MGFFKDLGLLILAASEEIDTKAREYKKKREDRFSDFEQSVEDKRKKIHSHFDEEFEKVKEHFERISMKLGLATKQDISEVKDMIQALSDKVDKGLKKGE